MYKLIKSINRRLSLWNARAVMIDKVDNSKPSDEPRMTFNYSRVTKLLSGIYLKLSFKVHNYLSNSRYEYLFIIDLKHTYLTIPLHPNNRYYFTFIILGIG